MALLALFFVKSAKNSLQGAGPPILHLLKLKKRHFLSKKHRFYAKNPILLKKVTFLQKSAEKGPNLHFWRSIATAKHEGFWQKVY